MSLRALQPLLRPVASSSRTRIVLISARRPLSSSSKRRYATEATDFDLSQVERATDEVDVCIVGGGPAGLSAAIRLKQLEAERGNEVRVIVLEKGSEIGESWRVRGALD